MKTYITEQRLLQSTLDDSCGCLAVTRDKLTADDGGANNFGTIDNLFDTGHPEGDVH